MARFFAVTDLVMGMNQDALTIACSGLIFALMPYLLVKCPCQRKKAYSGNNPCFAHGKTRLTIKDHHPPLDHHLPLDHHPPLDHIHHPNYSFIFPSVVLGILILPVAGIFIGLHLCFKTSS